MTRDELRRAIELGREGVCVERNPAPGFPCRVREVSISRGFRVCIEFNVFGYDEGGPRYVGNFESLDEVVEELELLLERDISEWRNFTASGDYPEPPLGWNKSPSDVENEIFRKAVVARQLVKSDRFENRSTYWASVERSDDPSR